MKPLAEKPGIKNSSEIFVWNSPGDYISLIGAGNNWIRVVSIPGSGQMNLIHLFCCNLNDLETSVMEYRKYISQKGTIWISWPEKTSGYITDFNDKCIGSFPLSLGLANIKVCSIDNLWSGLKFVIRKN